jgi:hypothetical protein
MPKKTTAAKNAVMTMDRVRADWLIKQAPLGCRFSESNIAQNWIDRNGQFLYFQQGQIAEVKRKHL